MEVVNKWPTNGIKEEMEFIKELNGAHLHGAGKDIPSDFIKDTVLSLKEKVNAAKILDDKVGILLYNCELAYIAIMFILIKGYLLVDSDIQLAKDRFNKNQIAIERLQNERNLRHFLISTFLDAEDYVSASALFFVYFRDIAKKSKKLGADFIQDLYN